MSTDMLILAHKSLGHFAVVVTGAGVFSAVDFTHTITLGSVLIVFVIAIVAGAFTVRSKIATIWREEAEGERAAKERIEDELAAEKLARAEDLANEKLARASFEKEQQALRHDLKDELAGVKASLRVMEAKTDLTSALDKIGEMNERTTEAIVAAMHSTSRLSEDRDASTHQLLTEIRDKLPAEPVEVREVSPE